MDRNPQNTASESAPAGVSSESSDAPLAEIPVATQKPNENVCNSLASARRLMFPVATFSLLVLAILAISYSLYFCKAIMLPITGAFLLNFLFSPIVFRARRYGVPNAVSALMILTVALAVFVVAAMFAYEPAKTWLSDKDKNLAIVEKRLLSLRQPLDTIRDMSEQIDNLTTGEENKDNDEAKDEEPTSGKTLRLIPIAGTIIELPESVLPKQEVSLTKKAAKNEIVPVEVRQPGISSRIFTTTGDTVVGLSLMIVLLYYLLAAGDRGLEKLVEMMPTFQNKRRIVELTRAIERSVSNYLLTTTIINAALGVVIGTGMWLIGMPNPVLWGVMAMFLNYFPFVGAIAGAVIVFFVAVITFDTISFSSAAPFIYLIANLVEANFITPVLLGRSVSLHPVWLMIFFVIVSWVWGLGGAIVAVPVLAVIKISCDHIEPLMPIGKFLGQ